MNESQLFAVAVTLLILYLTWRYLRSLDKKSASNAFLDKKIQLEAKRKEEEQLAALPTGISTKLPEDQEKGFVEAAKLVPAYTENEGDEAQQLRQKACGLLAALAESYIRVYKVAQVELENIAAHAQRTTSKKAKKHLTEVLEQGRKDHKAMEREKQKIVNAATTLRPGYPGWGAAIFQEVCSQARASRIARRAQCHGTGTSEVAPSSPLAGVQQDDRGHCGGCIAIGVHLAFQSGHPRPMQQCASCPFVRHTHAAGPRRNYQATCASVEDDTCRAAARRRHGRHLHRATPGACLCAIGHAVSTYQCRVPSVFAWCSGRERLLARHCARGVVPPVRDHPRWLPRPVRPIAARTVMRRSNRDASLEP